MTEKLNEQAKGVYIISATPFDEDGGIDYASIDSLIEFYIEKGVSGMTILGMMGEATKMSPAESQDVMRHMLNRVGGRIPVIVGVSDPGLSKVATLAKSSMDEGAAGVMLAPMGGLKTEEQIYNYFAQAFSAMGDGIPVCFQDYPQSTGVHISVDCFNNLVRDFDQLVMLKHEDCPGLGKLTRISNAPASDSSLRAVSILVGNGGIYLPEELSRGAHGAMTGFAFPEMLVDVVKGYEEGNIEAANDLFDTYLPLVRYEQQPGFGLAVRKETLRRRGAIKSAATRAPGPALNQVDQEELTRLLNRLEQRLKEH